MTPQLTEENVLKAILICFVVAFFSVEIIVNWIVRQTVEMITESTTATPQQMYRCSRMAAAAVTMRVLSYLLRAASCLALALGLWKAFGDIAQLILPDKALGVALLISYCGLFTVIGVVADDFGIAFKKLLGGQYGGKGGDGGAATPTAAPGPHG